MTKSATSAAAVLDLHRRLVATPSVSGQEEAIVDLVAGMLEAAGARVERTGRNIIARGGRGPRLLLNSHIDTVPPGPEWTRDPWDASVTNDGRVHGLGSNDAKAAVAAMAGAFIEVVERGGPCEVALMLVCDEETGGEGTEVAWPQLRASGWVPDGVVVGEPTGLQIATAQKGMLVLELVATGDGGHSAHAAATGARNAVIELARDLIRLESAELGESHAVLGRTTLTPTLTQGGTARNVVPARASSVLDLRTVPGVSHDELVERVRSTVDGEIRVLSDRLEPRASPEDARIVRAARRAHPEARLYGSPTMSDLVFFADVPAIKCGPGRSERSHRPDEFVLESEIIAGRDFYRRLIEAFAASGDAA